MVRSIFTPGKIILSGAVLIGLLFTGILLIAMDSGIWLPPESELNLSEEPETQGQIALSATATQSQVLPILTPTPDAVHNA